MKKSLGYKPKIELGIKKIESRWLKNRSSPWNKVHKGDVIFFKNTGGLIDLKAYVVKVLQYENLDPLVIGKILQEFSKDIGIDSVEDFKESILNKNYCVLVFLSNVKKVEPFQISKKGFGLQSSWITTESIEAIKTI